MNNSAYSTVPCNQHIHELKIFIFTPPQLTWLFFPSLCSCHSFLLAKFRERETQSKKWLPALNRSNFLWAEKAFEFASSTHRQLQYNIAGQNMSTRHQHGWIKACTGSFKTGHMNMEWNWNSPSKLDIIIWSGTGTPYLDQIPRATVPLLSIGISLQALDEPASVNLASTLNLKLLKPSEGSLTRLTQKVIKLLCQLLSQYFPLFWG